MEDRKVDNDNKFIDGVDKSQEMAHTGSVIFDFENGIMCPNIDIMKKKQREKELMNSNVKKILNMNYDEMIKYFGGEPRMDKLELQMQLLLQQNMQLYLYSKLLQTQQMHALVERMDYLPYFEEKTNVHVSPHSNSKDINTKNNNNNNSKDINSSIIGKDSQIVKKNNGNFKKIVTDIARQTSLSSIHSSSLDESSGNYKTDPVATYVVSSNKQLVSRIQRSIERSSVESINKNTPSLHDDSFSIEPILMDEHGISKQNLTKMKRKPGLMLSADRSNRDGDGGDQHQS